VFRTTNGFVPLIGDIISVTSWNDTAQQEIVTLVFQGPVTSGITLNEPYDSTDFDSGTITNDPGSYDYTEGDVVVVNDFQLGRIVPDPTRMWVTKNGKRVFYGDDYLISGTQVLLHGPAISVTDVVIIELFSDSVVPEAMAFRIFQDMRGVQATYRITPSTTTELIADLDDSDDVMYVANAAALTQPDLVKNIWGILTINGERIMYRDLNIEAGTVSGLRRGTAGTAVESHSTDAVVYNLGRGNLLEEQYQDTYLISNSTGDGSTLTYTAADIDLSNLTTAQLDRAVLVYVGGIYQTNGYTVTASQPVSVVFDTAPAAGYQVSIRVRQGLSWYQPGANTASNGIALQVTDTIAARFFRGQ
jgi:hypothetical protein